MTHLLNEALVRSFSSNGNIYEGLVGAIRVLTCCKIRPRGSTNCRMRCKRVSVITRPQCWWMWNIKEFIEWEPGKPGSHRRLCSSSHRGHFTKHKNEIRAARAKTRAGLRRWEIENEIPQQPEKGTSTLECVTQAYRAHSPPFSYPNVVEYFQCLITCILCGKEKILSTAKCAQKLIRPVCSRLKEAMSFSLLLLFTTEA